MGRMNEVRLVLLAIVAFVVVYLAQEVATIEDKDPTLVVSAKSSNSAESDDGAEAGARAGLGEQDGGEPNVADQDEHEEEVALAPVLQVIGESDNDDGLDEVDSERLFVSGEPGESDDEESTQASGPGEQSPGAADQSVSTLPRTDTKPYNAIDPSQKYMIYSPSGGFNNQLSCLLSASHMAKVLGRTLIVPANGKHSSMAWGYYALKQKDIIPMDHALDFPFMEKALGVPLLATNITLRQFHKDVMQAVRRESSKLVDVIHAPKRTGFYGAPPSVLKEYLAQGSLSKKQFLWYEGRFYTKYWARKAGLYKYIRYSPYLRELSKRICHEVFNGTAFNAFHIRMGDYVKKLKQESSANSRAFVRASTKFGFARDTPVYVATDGHSSSKYFAALKDHFPRIVFQTDLAENPTVRRWLRHFNRNLPKSEIRSDLFGLVEQMICAQARHYIGTSVSTFSQTIAKTRGSIRNALPHVNPAAMGNTALIHWTGRISYLKRDANEPSGSTQDSADGQELGSR